MILIETRLGIIACRYLAKSYIEDKYITAKEIAEYYNMDLRVLLVSLRKLTRSGILISQVADNNVGFKFASDPKHISVRALMDTLEGKQKFDCCKELMPGLRCDCYDRSKCEIYGLFKDVISKTEDQLSNITIADYTIK